MIIKTLENIKNCDYQRRHLYKLNPVLVDGVSYKVMSLTPQHTEEIQKKVKDILKYLINGK